MLDTILKPFFPYQTITIRSTKPVTVVKQLIDENHSSFAKTFPYADKSKLFLGDRRNDSFKLYQPFYFLRPVAVLTGKLDTDAEGTVIDITIRPGILHFSAIMLVILLSLVILFTEAPQVMMLKIPLMLGFFGLLHYLFYRQAQKAYDSFQHMLSMPGKKPESEKTEPHGDEEREANGAVDGDESKPNDA